MSICLDKKQINLTAQWSNLIDVATNNKGNEGFDPAKFAKWLRDNRSATNLSMTALAEKAGLSKQRISQLEGGDKPLLTELPSQLALDKVERIAKILGADINEARRAAGYVSENGKKEIPESVRNAFAREGKLSPNDEILIANFVEMLKKQNKETEE